MPVRMHVQARLRRNSLSRSLTSVLLQAPKSLQRIIYVSCGFKALETDTAVLLQGGWKLVHAEGHVFFPGSDHLESLAIFDRV